LKRKAEEEARRKLEEEARRVAEEARRMAEENKWTATPEPVEDILNLIVLILSNISSSDT
ncbi:hypothetical protein ONJ95_26835, partial [Salmonella enterica subsp. enterica serovar Virginia]|nr:hypothetical protein [Salmonella enterica subsp. enterica serovar Virginia]